jgi:hypothetical protein
MQKKTKIIIGIAATAVVVTGIIVGVRYYRKRASKNSAALPSGGSSTSAAQGSSMSPAGGFVAGAPAAGSSSSASSQASKQQNPSGADVVINIQTQGYVQASVPTGFYRVKAKRQTKLFYVNTYAYSVQTGGQVGLVKVVDWDKPNTADVKIAVKVKDMPNNIGNRYNDLWTMKSNLERA